VLVSKQEFKAKIWKIYRIVLRKIDPFPHLRYVKKKKFIFIHIPKTAGTSVLKALGIDFRFHLEWPILEAANPQLFRKSYKFCFVRNPYDRLVSVYTYIKGGGAGGVDREFQQLLKDRYETFDKFVLEYLDKDIIHEHPLLKPQYLYIFDFLGNQKVDYIGKFENLEKDFFYISSVISVHAELPCVNTSKREKYSAYYSSELKNKVSTLYSKDFEMLEYTK